jgi:DNA-binding transcriptional LysR family regulator
MQNAYSAGAAGWPKEWGASVDDLQYIAVFRKVAETGNFSAAAEALGMTPSTVSRQITRLEERLGVQLLARTTRNLRLTEAGSTFYDACARGMVQLEEAIRAISEFQQEPQGLLRVGTTPFFGRLHIVPAITDFIAQHPKVSVDLSLGHADSSILESGRDVLVRAAPLSGGSFTSQPLAPMEHVICATPGYLQERGTPRVPRELVHYNCLISTRPVAVCEWPFIIGRRRHQIRVSGNFRADGMEAIYYATVAGLGIARLPNYVVGPDLRSGRLVSLFPGGAAGADGTLGDATTPSTMRAFYLKSRFPDPKITAFIEFLKERFKGNYSWERRETDTFLR